MSLFSAHRRMTMMALNSAVRRDMMTLEVVAVALDDWSPPRPVSRLGNPSYIVCC